VNKMNTCIHRRLSRAAAVALFALLCFPHERSEAQWRVAEPRVVTLPAPSVPAPRDVVGPFRASYEAAGRPRIVLFWNVAFDDETETVRQAIETTNRDGTQRTNSLHKQTSGPAGAAQLIEDQTDNREKVERVTTHREIDPAKQSSLLSDRNSAQLESTLRQQLQNAGVRLLDRAASIRLTEAEKDRAGVDPKLIETDAVMDRAELLLEIIMVKDADAPLGAAFKVAVTELKSGEQIASLYTLARPELPPPPGRYVVTNTGFEWRQPPVQVGIPEIGVELSRELMQALGQHLPVS
jgi:hypothetical protein